MTELPLPAPAQTDPEAFELLRVWIARNTTQVSAQFRSWDDASVWGIALADVARLLSEQLAQMTAGDASKLLGQIQSGFTAELAQQSN